MTQQSLHYKIISLKSPAPGFQIFAKKYRILGKGDQDLSYTSKLNACKFDVLPHRWEPHRFWDFRWCTLDHPGPAWRSWERTVCLWPDTRSSPVDPGPRQWPCRWGSCCLCSPGCWLRRESGWKWEQTGSWSQTQSPGLWWNDWVDHCP